MPNIYCPSCGTGNKFLYEKPKVCNSCKFVFAAPLKTPFQQSSPSNSFSYQRSPKEKFSLKDLKLEVEKIEPIKLSSVLGTDPNSESYKRKGVSKEEYKQKVFKADPISIDND